MSASPIGCRATFTWFPDEIHFEENTYSTIGKNLRKAIDEANKTPVLVTLEEIAAQPRTRSPKLSITHYEQTDAGPCRKSNEDAYFYATIDEGELMGVFDGHGGSSYAVYAQKQFPLFFQECLKTSKNIREAFESTISMIHHNGNESFGGKCGSTAVICYIKNNRIWTATLGDSEARLFRRMDPLSSDMKMIPLSVVRTWASPKEFKLLTESLKFSIRKDQKPDYPESKVEERYKKFLAKFGTKMNPKVMRYPPDEYIPSGVNVARAIGDEVLLWKPANKTLKHLEGREPEDKSDHHSLVFSKDGIRRAIKPKVTEFDMLPGDILCLMSDGLSDYLGDVAMAEVVKDNQNREMLPLELINSAIKNMTSRIGDNITVITVFADT